jgi:hypothetical protein
VSLPRRYVDNGTSQLTVSETTVKLSGVIEDPNVRGWLVPILRNVHDDCVAQKVVDVVLDIRGLTYGNAAVWGSVVEWMRLAREAGPRRYAIRLRVDPASRWQRIGIAALTALTKDTLTIE